MASVGTRKREVLGAKEIRALKFLRSRILQLPTKVMSTSLQTWYVFTFFVFFLWYGRSRSKARSLHEKKLLVRKLLHGRRWSHAAWQIKTTKTQTKNTRQDADPPARFASHHPKDSKANSERGKSPTRKTTKDLPRHSGKNPLCRNKLKNMQRTN